ncbi:hypothetical protein HPB51_015715 [Rhipicephalus microplus]|uniref:Protein kinase domain-containing protein n=1 Tax=Rhipicephalus microplus TaxID=6941 RepID=A0A9J6EH64_RHIMP|nr:hypothetical protein HPB51_015715 [Rhipicephalus microplus]
MNNFVIMEKIDEGTYGVDYKAKCKTTNKVVAMKKTRVEGADEANVPIDDNDDLKVADLGFCRAFTLPMRTLTHEVDTMWYRAPEILTGASRYSTSVTPTVDTWPKVKQLPNYKPAIPMWRKNIMAELLLDLDGEAVDLLLKMLIYSAGEIILAKYSAALPYLAG